MQSTSKSCIKTNLRRKATSQHFVKMAVSQMKTSFVHPFTQLIGGLLAPLNTSAVRNP